MTLSGEPGIEIVRTRGGKRSSVAWGFVAVPLLTLTVVIALAGSLRASFLTLGLAAACLTFALRSLSMRRTHLEVREGVLTFRGLFRDRVLNEPGVPGRVVGVVLKGVPQPDGQIWIGSRDRVMLMTAAWGDNALTDLADRLGWPITHEPNQLTLTELDERYPGIVAWYGVHPKLAAVVFLAIFFAVFLPLTL